jgi:two-component system sensor histidine kinase AlgZ
MPRAAGPILKLPLFLRWITLLALIITTAAVGGLIAMSTVTLLHVIPASRFWTIYFVCMRIAVVITLIFTLSTLFHGVLMNKLNRVTAELKEREAAEERLRQAATEARLSSLESRIHPHFLFNTRTRSAR